MAERPTPSTKEDRTGGTSFGKEAALNGLTTSSEALRSKPGEDREEKELVTMEDGDMDNEEWHLMDEEDWDALLLNQSNVLTQEELIRRRGKYVRRLLSVYKAQYWSLMEEVRSKHRKFFLRNGHGGWQEKEYVDSLQNQNAKERRSEPHAPDKPANVTLHCAAPGPCFAKPLALSVFCLDHILLEPRQKLYKPCTFTIKSGQTSSKCCGRPVLCAITPLLCPEHQSEMQKQTSKGKRPAEATHTEQTGPKSSPKLHMIINEYVRVIQQKRRALKVMVAAANAAAIAEVARVNQFSHSDRSNSASKNKKSVTNAEIPDDQKPEIKSDEDLNAISGSNPNQALESTTGSKSVVNVSQPLIMPNSVPSSNEPNHLTVQSSPPTSNSIDAPVKPLNSDVKSHGFGSISSSSHTQSNSTTPVFQTTSANQMNQIPSISNNTTSTSVAENSGQKKPGAMNNVPKTSALEAEKTPKLDSSTSDSSMEKPFLNPQSSSTAKPDLTSSSNPASSIPNHTVSNATGSGNGLLMRAVGNPKEKMNQKSDIDPDDKDCVPIPNPSPVKIDAASSIQPQNGKEKVVEVLLEDSEGELIVKTMNDIDDLSDFMRGEMIYDQLNEINPSADDLFPPECDFVQNKTTSSPLDEPTAACIPNNHVPPHPKRVSDESEDRFKKKLKVLDRTIQNEVANSNDLTNHDKEKPFNSPPVPTE